MFTQGSLFLPGFAGKGVKSKPAYSKEIAEPKPAPGVPKGETPAGLGNTAGNPQWRFCFPEGTPIETPTGQRLVESICNGDLVNAWDFETTSIVSRRVITTFVRHTRTIHTITVDTGSSIDTTAGHPFWVLDRGWVEAQHLAAGMRLLGSDRRPVRIQAISRANRLATVYNFEVEGSHNYFAGEHAVLVHNDGGEPFDRSFNDAINRALDWLRNEGVDTSKPIAPEIGKFGPNAGKPIGVKFAGGGEYRIEFDARNGAHINAEVGKLKGPHFKFEGNQRSVQSILRQLFSC